jgi:hypothetical protein
MARLGRVHEGRRVGSIGGYVASSDCPVDNFKDFSVQWPPGSGLRSKRKLLQGPEGSETKRSLAGWSIQSAVARFKACRLTESDRPCWPCVTLDGTCPHLRPCAHRL